MWHCDCGAANQNGHSCTNCKRASPTPFPCIEATLDIPLGDKTARLWLKRESILDIRGGWGKQARAVTAVQEFDTKNPKATLTAWLEFLVTLPDVNAVQMQWTDSDGVKWGGMVYTVDF